MIYYIGLNVPARLKTVQPFKNSDKNKLFNSASGKKLQATEREKIYSQYLMFLSLVSFSERDLTLEGPKSSLFETNEEKRKI